MSPYHFARLFQHSTGLPPHRFVVRARIDHAATLLAAPELSIAQISRVVGFRTPSHFATVFRRLMGVTPSAYRAAARQGQPDGREREAAMWTPVTAAVLDAHAAAVHRGRPLDRDAALVERLRRHEAGAAEALVAEYGDRVYRLAIRITGNSSDAEEVVQDALWAAARKIDTFRGTAAFGSWVYRITANAAYQKRRRAAPTGTRRRGRSSPRPSTRPAEPVQPGADWSPRLQDPALQAELHAVLRAAIDELPGEHRATFLLHDVEGLSNPEIAETLRIKPATVKSRVHRARLSPGPPRRLPGRRPRARLNLAEAVEQRLRDRRRGSLRPSSHSCNASHNVEGGASWIAARSSPGPPHPSPPPPARPSPRRRGPRPRPPRAW